MTNFGIYYCPIISLDYFGLMKCLKSNVVAQLYIIFKSINVSYQFELYAPGQKGLLFLLRTERPEPKLPWIPRPARHAALRRTVGPIFLLNNSYLATNLSFRISTL